MSRNTYDIKEEYIGTGSLSAYTFDFKITDLSQLEIVELDDSNVETQRVRGGDLVYLSSVTFDNVAGGGTVNLTANLTLNYKLLILLADDAPIQNYEFRNKRSFTLRTFEEALDRIVGAVQRLTYRAARSLRLHETDDSIDPQLPPDVAGNADRLIKVNATGDGFDYGASVAEIGGATTPLGGEDKGVLQKASAADGDLEWSLSAALSGYSNRFSESFTSTGLIDTLIKILDISYAAPLISLVASGSTTVREKGDSVASTTLTATTTKTTDDFVTVEFFQDAISIDDNTPPANPSGGTEVHTHSVPFSDNTTFRADVTDDGASGGPTTVSSSRSFTFVYPYYYGVGAAGLTPAQVAALTKDIRTENTNYDRSYGAATAQVYYFAYPASYGTLSSILDENGFEVFGDWTLTVANITGLDASAVSYNIYEFNNVVTAGATNFVFAQ